MMRLRAGPQRPAFLFVPPKARRFAPLEIGLERRRSSATLILDYGLSWLRGPAASEAAGRAEEDAMRATQPVQAPDDGGAPVWTRARRKSSNPLMNLVGFVLILFALLIIVLTALNGGSFAKGGGQVDGWIASVTNAVTGAKAKAVAMDQATPVEPASAPASSAPAPAQPPAAKP
jgi:hypothetical protein